jgi:hypothetical protein
MFAELGDLIVRRLDEVRPRIATLRNLDARLTTPERHLGYVYRKMTSAGELRPPHTPSAKALPDAANDQSLPSTNKKRR